MPAKKIVRTPLVIAKASGLLTFTRHPSPRGNNTVPVFVVSIDKNLLIIKKV